MSAARKLDVLVKNEEVLEKFPSNWVIYFSKERRTWVLIAQYFKTGCIVLILWKLFLSFRLCLLPSQPLSHRHPTKFTPARGKNSMLPSATCFFCNFGSSLQPLDLQSAFQKGETTAFSRDNCTLKKPHSQTLCLLESVPYQQITGERGGRREKISKTHLVLKC